MRKMRISDDSLKNELRNFIKQNMLIPFIGSGFSKGERSGRGVVCSGDEMRSHMINTLLMKCPDFASKDQYVQQNFSQISQIYENKIEKEDKKQYLRKHFFNVNLSEDKKQFLNQPWNFIYTLNIDDGIERSSDKYEVFTPNKTINEEFFKYLNEDSKVPLFKLHGDVKEQLKHSNDNMIFSRNDYIRSLQSNKFLLSKLSSDLHSNCILFIGCSLSDEIDIIYSGINSSKKDGTNLIHTYFVTDNKNLKGIEEFHLKDHGVDTIIEVDDYGEFYKQIQSLFTLVENEVEKEHIFRNTLISYEQSDSISTSKNDFSYLGHSTFPFRKFKDRKKQILLPSFFISRYIKDKNQVVQVESVTQIVTIVYGHRFSGKTYCLLDLYRKCIDRDRIFIPEILLLNSSVLKDILNKVKDVTLFLDINNIEEDLSKFISNNLSNFKNRNVRIVMTLTSSKKKNMFIFNQLSGKLANHEKEVYINLIYIDNYFSKKEIDAINEKLSNTLIGGFTFLDEKNKKVTLLDNIYKSLSSSTISTNSVNSDRQILLKNFDSEEISSDLIQILLVILIQNGRISMQDIDIFCLYDVVNDITQKYDSIFQYDYMNITEKGYNDSSSIKLICNSKYWVIKQLQFISSNIQNYSKISSAYVNIVKQLNNYYLSDKNKSRNTIGKYIKFDEINDIFAVKDNGSKQLIAEIYDSLFEQLKDNFQYLHQRAKSLSWERKKSDSLNKALEFVEKSKHEIERIYKNNYMLKEEYSHVCYTRASILIRLAQCESNNNENYNNLAIEAIYTAIHEFSKNVNYILSDNEQGRPNEFVKFIKDIVKKDNLNESKYKSQLEYLFNNIIKNPEIKFNKKAYSNRSKNYKIK